MNPNAYWMLSVRNPMHPAGVPARRNACASVHTLSSLPDFECRHRGNLDVGKGSRAALSVCYLTRLSAASPDASAGLIFQPRMKPFRSAVDRQRSR